MPPVTRRRSKAVDPPRFSAHRVVVCGYQRKRAHGASGLPFSESHLCDHSYRSAARDGEVDAHAAAHVRARPSTYLRAGERRMGTLRIDTRHAVERERRNRRRRADVGMAERQDRSRRQGAKAQSGQIAPIHRTAKALRSAITASAATRRESGATRAWNGE